MLHVLYSSAHASYSRTIDAGDNPSEEPNNVEKHESKSPSANPCRYASLSVAFTIGVRRLYFGTNCDWYGISRSRGTSTATGPMPVVISRGAWYPLRYGLSPASRAVS